MSGAHGRVFVVTGIWALVGAGCIPARDNAFDPAVRPRPAVTVLVNGSNTGAVGSRSSTWELQQTGDDPDDELVSFSWLLSTRFEEDANELAPEDWIAIGTGATVTSSPQNDFGAELLRIRDFVGSEPGTGATFRWVAVDVRDEAGHEVRAYARLTLLNRAPTVDLGPDLRVAPGGRWWELDPSTDSIADSAPFLLRLEARTEDADGDAAFILTAEYPALWRVEGALADVLDVAPQDGFVDESFFSGDPGRGSLEFAAPIFPGTTRFQVQVSDLLDSSGVPVYGDSGTDHLVVEVASSVWVRSADSGGLLRLDTSAFPVDLAAGAVTPPFPVHRPVARDGDRLLMLHVGDAFNPSSVDAMVVDFALNEQQRRNAVISVTGSNDRLFAMRAVADGAGGWWVLDALLGTLYHLDPSLTVDRTISDLEGTTASDLVDAKLAPRTGTTDVWACTTRLYRIPVSGAPLLAGNAFSNGAKCGAIVSDDAGGAWLGAIDVGPRVRRVNATGLEIIEEAAGGFVTALGWDADRRRLWGHGLGVLRLREYDSDGTFLGPETTGALQPTYSLSRIDVDERTGHVDVHDAGFGGFLTLTTAMNVVGFYLTSETADEGYRMAGDMVVAWEDFSRFLVRERPFADSSSAIPLSLFQDGTSPQAPPAAVDPRNGMVWTLTAQGYVEGYAANGDFLHRIDVFGGSPVSNARAALAFDPSTGRLWVAWGDGSAGGLIALETAVDPRDAPTVVPDTAAGFDLVTVTDLELSPGGPLCVAGHDDLGAAVGFSYVPGGARVDVSIGAESWAATAEPPLGGCLFVDDPFEVSSVVSHIDAQGSETTWPGNMMDVPTRGPEWDFWEQKAYFLHSNSPGDWLYRYDGGAETAVPVSLASGTTLAAEDLPIGLFADPFYRQLWVSFGSTPNNPSLDGHLIRIDAGRRQVGPVHSFRAARLELGR